MIWRLAYLKVVEVDLPQGRQLLDAPLAIAPDDGRCLAGSGQRAVEEHVKTLWFQLQGHTPLISHPLMLTGLQHISGHAYAGLGLQGVHAIQCGTVCSDLPDGCCVPAPFTYGEERKERERERERERECLVCWVLSVMWTGREKGGGGGWGSEAVKSAVLPVRV